MTPCRIFLLTAAGLAVALSSRADRPEALNFIRYEDPVYPASLASTRVSDGSATVAFTVDREGRVIDALILSATHPAFGETVLNAVKHWQLAPEASWTSSNNRREVVRYQFSKRMTVSTLTSTDGLKLFFSNAVEGALPLQSYKWAELPHPPLRLGSVTPEYPAALLGEFPSGSAVVSFVIDVDGQVRVPAVVAADRVEFGEAALMAVKQWKFEAPRLDGRPVNVQVERKFNFGRPTASVVPTGSGGGSA